MRASSATGTDPEHRGGELRLDISEEALAPRDEGPAIIPGKPMESAIIKRILDTDPDNTMPPPEAHLVPLKSEQIETLKTWIANGAVYEDHWAFETPVKAPFTEKLTTNPVDNFIRARLAKEGLAPSPEAPLEIQIRRLFLDLTGLPPTPAQTTAFLADTSPDRWKKRIRSLMESPRSGSP